MNSLQDPLLGPVSYANDGLLDPRPAAGSPVYTDVLAGAPEAVDYRGAFSGPADDWADGWTALSQYGYLKPAEAGPVDPITPTPLALSRSGENVQISFSTQDGVVYRIFTSTDLLNWEQLSGRNGTWHATGQEVSVTLTAGSPATFYQVVASYE